MTFSNKILMGAGVIAPVLMLAAGPAAAAAAANAAGVGCPTARRDLFQDSCQIVVGREKNLKTINNTMH